MASNVIDITDVLSEDVPLAYRSLTKSLSPKLLLRRGPVSNSLRQLPSSFSSLPQLRPMCQEILKVSENVPIFLSIVGDAISSAKAREILLGAGGDLEVALNHFFANPSLVKEPVKEPNKASPSLEKKPATPLPQMTPTASKPVTLLSLSDEKDESPPRTPTLHSFFTRPMKENEEPSESSSDEEVQYRDGSDSDDNPVREEPRSPGSLQFEEDLALALKLSAQEGIINTEVKKATPSSESKKRKWDELDSADEEIDERNVRPRVDSTLGSSATSLTITDYNKDVIMNSNWARDPIYFRMNVEMNRIIEYFQNYRSPEYRLAPQPPELKVDLRDYQRMSLAWMIDRETFGWRLPREDRFMHQIELVRGGFLCEEMGLGKTCEILALILARKAQAGIPKKPTLIVCTLTLISQWKIEIQKLVRDGALKVAYWHGSGRVQSYEKQIGRRYYGNIDAHYFDDVDIVLTSWTVLKDKRLSSQRWLRVVLDESQILRNYASGQSRQALALEATYRWCVTGTPISGGLSDLRGALKFLRARPFADDTFWKSICHSKYRVSGTGYNYFVELLRIGMMRHTKDQKINGVPIVQFPSKTTRTILITLSDEEKRQYDRLETDVINEVKKIVRTSGVYINSRYTSLVQQLSQLREFCSLPSLALAQQGQKVISLPGMSKEALGFFAKPPPSRLVNWDDSDDDDDSNLTKALPTPPTGPSAEDKARLERVNAIRKKLEEADRYHEDCAICMNNPMEAPMCLPNCLHVWCTGCIMNWITSKDAKTCPTCRAPFKKEDLIEVPYLPKEASQDIVDEDAVPMDLEDSEEELRDALRESELEAQRQRQRELALKPQFKPVNPAERLPDGGKVDGSSMRNPSKIQRLINDVNHLRAVNPRAKVVVFSQWRNTLIAIGDRFRQENITYASLDGSMSEKERSSALERFNSDERCVAFLLSIRVGSVGISLTAAHHIFLMDHCLNPATEKQAVNRCHRLGQDRPVTVVKYIVEGSMEHKLHLLRNAPDVLETVENDVDDLKDDSGSDDDDDEQPAAARKVVHAIDVPVMLKLFGVRPQR